MVMMSRYQLLLSLAWAATLAGVGAIALQWVALALGHLLVPR
jgi:hypothetical protein